MGEYSVLNNIPANPPGADTRNTNTSAQVSREAMKVVQSLVFKRQSDLLPSNDMYYTVVCTICSRHLKYMISIASTHVAM